MDTLSYKTLSSNKETANKEWFIVDAENQILGRMSSKIAMILRGKHKTNYTPHADCADYVIVINADKSIITDRKIENISFPLLIFNVVISDSSSKIEFIISTVFKES